MLPLDNILDQEDDMYFCIKFSLNVLTHVTGYYTRKEFNITKKKKNWYDYNLEND